MSKVLLSFRVGAKTFKHKSDPILKLSIAKVKDVSIKEITGSNRHLFAPTPGAGRACLHWLLIQASQPSMAFIGLKKAM